MPFEIKKCKLNRFCLELSRKSRTFAPLNSKKTDSLAQLVEHNTFNVGVLGSNPKRITPQRGLWNTSGCAVLAHPLFYDAKTAKRLTRQDTRPPPHRLPPEPHRYRELSFFGAFRGPPRRRFNTFGRFGKKPYLYSKEQGRACALPFSCRHTAKSREKAVSLPEETGIFRKIALRKNHRAALLFFPAPNAEATNPFSRAGICHCVKNPRRPMPESCRPPRRAPAPRLRPPRPACTRRRCPPHATSAAASSPKRRSRKSRKTPLIGFRIRRPARLKSHKAHRGGLAVRRKNRIFAKTSLQRVNITTACIVRK